MHLVGRTHQNYRGFAKAKLWEKRISPNLTPPTCRKPNKFHRGWRTRIPADPMPEWDVCRAFVDFLLSAGMSFCCSTETLEAKRMETRSEQKSAFLGLRPKVSQGQRWQASFLHQSVGFTEYHLGFRVDQTTSATGPEERCNGIRACFSEARENFSRVNLPRSTLARKPCWCLPDIKQVCAVHRRWALNRYQKEKLIPLLGRSDVNARGLGCRRERR
ncbi:hypothetical protein GN956_G16511 [Arapaima gigas]